MKLFVSSLNSTVGQVQPIYGCTDPLALNYNPLATVSDGSCVYSEPNTITNYFIDDTEWVLAVYDDMRVKISGTKTSVSKDNGLTYPYETNSLPTGSIVSAQILANGNILFFSRYNTTDIYVTDSELGNIRVRKAYLPDGTTAWSTSTLPADRWLYTPIDQAKYLKDTNLFVWGNYILGADGDTGIFYTTDFGESFKVCRDFRGEANNPRHMHSIEYNKWEDKWLAFAGDHYSENAWYEGDYDSINDSWTWLRLHPINTTQLDNNIKGTGVFFLRHNNETYMYWGADVESGLSQYYGLWRVKWSERADQSKFQLVFDTKNTIPNSTIVIDIAINADNVIVALVRGAGDMYYVALGVETFTTYPIPIEYEEFLVTTFTCGMGMPTTDGYFRIQQKYMTEAQTKTGWIKPGTGLFQNYTSVKP